MFALLENTVVRNSHEDEAETIRGHTVDGGITSVSSLPSLMEGSQINDKLGESIFDTADLGLDDEQKGMKPTVKGDPVGLEDDANTMINTPIDDGRCGIQVCWWRNNVVGERHLAKYLDLIILLRIRFWGFASIVIGWLG